MMRLGGHNEADEFWPALLVAILIVIAFYVTALWVAAAGWM